ncbi:hypothetical protein [Viridibacterium curvum]|uniref:Uncharacterized protein n=1 Tax=Viridibacterium curvum TaxID=1101404 RepID=A0ABP9QQ68_9RHOO
MNSNTPPKSLGVLVAIFGALLVGSSFVLDLPNSISAWYFVILGTGYFLTGVFLYEGRQLATAAGVLTLLWAWGASWYQFGSQWELLLPRLGFPTILGVYLQSHRVTSRLGPIVVDDPDIDEPDETHMALAERITQLLSQLLGNLPRVLLVAMLAYLFWDMLNYFSRKDMLSAALSKAWLLWMLVPYACLLFVITRGERNGIRDGALLFAGFIAAVLGIAMYESNLPGSSHRNAVKLVAWLPLVQLIWVFAYTRVLDRKLQVDD